MTLNTLSDNTILRILLWAWEIPDDSEVSKRTGDAVYTLKKKIKVYADKNIEKPVEIDVEGCFLVGPRGSINQIKEDTLLHWNISVEDLKYYLEEITYERKNQ